MARVFYLFPLHKDKILFISFNGKQYSCNPKYIYEYLQNNGRRYNCVWCFVNNKNIPDVKYFKKSNIILYFWHNLTAKIIITNDMLSTRVPYRKKQIIIYTGHGGGSYKKCGFDTNPPFFIKYFYRIAGNSVSYAVSPSSATSRDYNTAYNITFDKILNFGMPRNDIFFTEKKETTQKLRSFYGIGHKTSIVLYAPTYRGDIHNSEMAAIVGHDKLIEALNTRFGKRFVLMVRAHHAIEKILIQDALNGSLYEDAQELLYAADALITDYSSIMWDFCLTGKPLFLFTPDWKKYAAERGFTIPITEWGFPLAATEAELIKNILTFDHAEHEKAVTRHIAMMGSYERGAATEQCAALIEKLL
jgi:CDP-glycerol glycerophosphotransferase